MVLKLYGYHRDTCTPRVALILREKNVPFEFIPVDLKKGEQKSPEYLKHQPFGSTPYIVRFSIYILLLHYLYLRSGRRRIYSLREQGHRLLHRLEVR